MRHHNSGYLVHNGNDHHHHHHHAYSTDGEESHPGIREPSEYAVVHKTHSMIKPVTSVQKNNRSLYDKESEKRHGSRNSRGSDYSRDSPPNIHRHNGFGSEIYVSNSAYRATSDLSAIPSSKIGDRAPSHYSYGSARSGGSTIKTKTSRHGGIVVETMSTPNPFCPNTKGMCCLLLLLNLGLILVTLGFVIVVQFFEPIVVWILGIVFLIFGTMTLVGSLIYCVHVFKNAKHPYEVNPEDLYWTKHWQGHVGSAPEIHYKAGDKYPDDGASDRHSKYSTNYSDRRSNRY